MDLQGQEDFANIRKSDVLSVGEGVGEGVHREDLAQMQQTRP